MATSNTLEEILERQCEKMRQLESATLLIKSKDVIKEELVKIRTTVSQVSNGVETMKRKLNETREQNNRLRELSGLLEELDKRIIHMEQNVPPELIRDYQKNCEISLSLDTVQEVFSPMITDNETEGEQTMMKDCKKVLFKEKDVCPLIPLLSECEFSKVPKYIIGRCPLETINNLIDCINQILKTKYTFLSMGKAHARKHGDLNLYLQYKKQDLDICTNTEYVYFFTAEDYERHTNTKLNKTKLNLLTVLRHCKRLREHRVKNDVRYVIQMNK